MSTPRDGRRWLPTLLVAAYAAFAARDFLADGLPIFFDAHSHLARSWMAARALAAGDYPTWSNSWYTGFRVFEFYSPGYHLVTGATSLWLGDVVSATRWVLWLGQVASAVAFHAFARRVTQSEWGAAFAAVLFVASPLRTTVIGNVGNHPTLFVYLFASLLLASVCRASGLARLAAAQALLVGAALASHLSNTLALLPALLSFELVWLCSAQGGGRPVRAVVGAIAASGVLALGLAGFLLEPYLFDLQRVSLSLEGPGLGMDRGALLRALGWLPYAPTHAFGRAEPSWCWVVGAAAALASLHPRFRRARPLAAGLLASVLSLGVIGERAAVGLDLFLLPLCAVGLGALARAAATLWNPRLGPALEVGGLVAALLWAGGLPGGSAHYQPEEALAAYARLPDTPLPSRTFDVTATTISLDGFYGWSSFSPYLSGRSVAFGGFPQAAPLSSNLSAALVGIAAAELRGNPPVLSQDAADLFYLLDVEFLVDRGTPELRRRLQLEVELRPVLQDLRYEPELGTLQSAERFRLRHASPAIFAPRVEEPPSDLAGARGGRDVPRLLPVLEERWRSEPSDQHPYEALDVLFRAGEGHDGAPLLPLLRGLGLDRSAARAARFWVDDARGAQESAGPPGRFEVLGHSEELARAAIEARAETPGWVRVSYAFDPVLEFRVDGRPVRALADALGSGSVVPFPAGTHTISIRRTRDTTRLWLGALSLALASGLGAYLAWASRRGPG